jgi:Ca-activated chloride channel family protein
MRWVFQDPLWLVALLALGAVAALRYWRRIPVFVVPHAARWQRATLGRRLPWAALAAYGGVALLIVALARPQAQEAKAREKQPGYDIMLAVDLSTSMYAEDFNRDGAIMNRLQAIKPILEAFINQRPNDRIGIVAFSGQAHTFAPLTFDHDWLRRQAGRLSIGLIEDGTAIGDAIGVGLARLRQGQRNLDHPKRLGAFLVLLTDGASNRGSLDPRLAAELAKEEGVVVFTIGAGAQGRVAMPVFDYKGRRIGTEMHESEIDNLLLRDIAEKTGGYFFRARDTQTVQEAFEGIDQATRVEFEAPPYEVTHELYPWFLAPALLALTLALAAALHEERRVGYA